MRMFRLSKLSEFKTKFHLWFVLFVDSGSNKKKAIYFCDWRARSTPEYDEKWHRMWSLILVINVISESWESSNWCFLDFSQICFWSDSPDIASKQIDECIIRNYVNINHWSWYISKKGRQNEEENREQWIRNDWLTNNKRSEIKKKEGRKTK